MKSFSIKGSTLKIIAVITMIVDHIGATVLQLMLNSRGILGYAVSGIESILTLDGGNRTLAIAWWIMRMIIGRIAFPVYCFLLIEGFYYTKSVAKYSLRLFLFAILSEIPFDLAIHQKLFTAHYQNVFFTLFIGLLVLWGISWYEKYDENMMKRLAGTVLVVAAGLFFAEFLHTDYGAAGILFIVLLYLYRKQKDLQILVGCVAGIVVLQELAAPLAFPFIAFYKGERGLKLKYFFYIIYPLHLILLYGVCIMLGVV